MLFQPLLVNHCLESNLLLLVLFVDVMFRKKKNREQEGKKRGRTFPQQSVREYEGNSLKRNGKEGKKEKKEKNNQEEEMRKVKMITITITIIITIITTDPTQDNVFSYVQLRALPPLFPAHFQQHCVQVCSPVGGE